MRPSIYIADDHPLLVKGLKDLLVEKGFTISGADFDGRSALNFILKNKPEIAILDIEMPFMTGLEIAKQCKKNNLKTKVILITLHKNIDLYLQAKKLNIFGYVLKEFALEEIENCINSVINNKPYFSASIKKLLHFTEEDNSILKKLTQTEIRILRLIALHKTNKEIAHLLFISPRTVEKHRSKIILKLDIDQKTSALLNWVQKNRHLFK